MWHTSETKTVYRLRALNDTYLIATNTLQLKGYPTTTRAVSQITKDTTGHALLIISLKDLDYPPSCTSLDRILQLCKVSSVSIHLLRRCCVYKTFEQTDRRTG